MDFIFMLTRNDRTVADCLEVVKAIAPLGLRHLGFKDVGVDLATLRRLNRAIKDTGATSYMEVVSTSPGSCLASARAALEIGVDRLLGGTQAREVRDILAGRIDYFPFPGRPDGHPTRLTATPEEIAEDCRHFSELGCAGVDLLAYRAIDGDPLALVRAARQATKGTVIVAGSIGKPEQIRALASAGSDAFTIGSAVFNGSFLPGESGLVAQLRAVGEACDAAQMTATG